MQNRRLFGPLPFLAAALVAGGACWSLSGLSAQPPTKEKPAAEAGQKPTSGGNEKPAAGGIEKPAAGGNEKPAAKPAPKPLPPMEPDNPKCDESVLDVKLVPAFAKLDPPIVRPIVLTHAGDGSNRVFVASQLGKVWVFPNKPDVEEAELFFDWQPKTTYKDNENEEGFLGMCFHPKYKENGQFFVYYTTREAPHVSVVSRFRVSKDDSDKADPKSEEEIIRIPQPWWNHNGGTICFGPDGFLYIALGDGGKANDVFKNAQNLGTLLGSILRIDVDHKSNGKNYAIPADNPFVSREGACPEIYAYGLRNPWRIAFDHKTGLLWCADVGQDLWEEIDLIVKGGNYGWSIREGKHPFGPDGVGPRADLVEPIWEYYHTVGKSITGGNVYRGKKVPELAGHYLYADYVTGLLWALKYDEKEKKVLANRSIKGNIHPVLSFGEDEAGETYYLNVHGHITTFASP